MRNLPWRVENKGRGTCWGGRPARVELQVHLGEAASENWGPDIVLTPKSHTSRQEVVSLCFGDERRVTRHHHSWIRVTMVWREVTRIPLVFPLVSHFFHKLKYLQNIYHFRFCHDEIAMFSGYSLRSALFASHIPVMDYPRGHRSITWSLTDLIKNYPATLPPLQNWSPKAQCLGDNLYLSPFPRRNRKKSIPEWCDGLTKGWFIGV